MKKFFLFCTLCIALVFGCDRINRSSFESALNNNDFEAAYKYAGDYEATKKVVIKKEAKYVLENQGEDGLARIKMIVNEHNAPWVYLDVLEMAVAMGDKDLAFKIYNMTDGYYNKVEANNIIFKAVESNQFDLGAEEKEELIYKLAEEKMELELGRIIDYHLPTPLPAGLCDYYDAYKDSYGKDVKDYNSKCNKLLRQALSYNNKKIADKTIEAFKKNCIAIKGSSSDPNFRDEITRVNGVKVDGNHGYIIYNWEDKEEALKEYNRVFGKQPTKTEKSKSHRIK